MGHRSRPEVALRSFLDGEFGDETLEISADGERKNVPWRYPLEMTTVSAGIIERKLRSTKVRLFTVPCCSIILFSSEGVKKKRIWIYS